MAGIYPDAPSWRMPLDKDGTVGVRISPANVVTQLTAGEMAIINNEAEDSVGMDAPFNGNGTIALLFPEKRDIDGYFFNGDRFLYTGGPIPQAYVSLNTTNGLDGTWTTIPTTGMFGTVASPTYRTNIASVTVLAARGIKMIAMTPNQYLACKNFHVYGEPAPGENPNRLALWHPTSDARIAPAYFDWGDTPRSSSADKLFRVKNLSSTLTANSVRVAMDVLTDTTPSVPAQHTLSFAAGAFLAQVNVGNLAPGAISGVVTLRRVTPANAVFGPWTFRVFGEANTWS